jgi:outer membrane protein
MRTLVGARVFAMVVGAVLSLVPAAHAQPRPQPPPTPTPPALAAPDPEDTTPIPVPNDLTVAHPGGITAEQVGQRAAATSWTARANEEVLRGAAARVDEAWASFLPRLSGLGKYTRLSHITPPQIALGPPGDAPVYATTPTAKGATNACVGGGCIAPAPQPLAFPVVVDNYLLQGTITVPISDYFLRIDQNYTSATHSQEAARWDVVGARATATANAKVAYYTWLRARGAVIVAVQAINDQRTHLRDARNQFAVGNASKADVLRAETAVASASLALVQAQSLASLTEKQIQVAMHVGNEAPLSPGEDFEASLPPAQGPPSRLLAEALGARAEVKSADANAQAARESASAAVAGRWPVLSAFADGIVANPNPRIFPQSQTTFASWDLGAQVTWSPNDVLVANGSVNDAQSRAASIEANKNVVRDGIEVEVTQYWQNVRQADYAIESGAHELASAEEAYRVARELFNNGRGTSTTLTDAETDLTRARLDLLNAKADAHIARVQLEHTLGRDAH